MKNIHVSPIMLSLLLMGGCAACYGPVIVEVGAQKNHAWRQIASVCPRARVIAALEPRSILDDKGESHVAVLLDAKDFPAEYPGDHMLIITWDRTGRLTGFAELLAPTERLTATRAVGRVGPVTDWVDEAMALGWLRPGLPRHVAEQIIRQPLFEESPSRTVAIGTQFYHMYDLDVAKYKPHPPSEGAQALLIAWRQGMQIYPPTSIRLDRSLETIAAAFILRKGFKRLTISRDGSWRLTGK